jgi:hypothetical protein
MTADDYALGIHNDELPEKEPRGLRFGQNSHDPFNHHLCWKRQAAKR